MPRQAGELTDEVLITPEMIEAGVAAWGALAVGDFELLDRDDFVALILRAGFDAGDFASPMHSVEVV